MESAVMPDGPNRIGGLDESQQWELPGCPPRQGGAEDAAWEKPAQPDTVGRLEQLLLDRLAAIETKLDTMASIEKKLDRIQQSVVKDQNGVPQANTKLLSSRPDAQNHGRRVSQNSLTLKTNQKKTLLGGTPTGDAVVESVTATTEATDDSDENSGQKEFPKGEDADGDSEPLGSPRSPRTFLEPEARDNTRHESGVSGVSCLSGEMTRSATKASSRPNSKSLSLLMPAFWKKVKSRNKWVEQVWTFFEEPESSWAAMVYSNVMLIIILCTTLIPVIQTLPSKPLSNEDFFKVSTATDLIFMGELFIRWAVSPSTIGFLLNFYNLLDVAIIGPFILRIAFYENLGEESDNSQMVEGVLLCMVPIMRLIKALKALPNFSLLWHTLRSAAVSMPIPIFMLCLIVVTFSSALYVAEPRDNIISMPHAMWLVAVTISTVGYGDVHPVTDGGRVITMVLIFIGLHFMAMPIAIVGAAFLETWKNRTRILCIGRMHGRLRQWGYTDDDLRMMFKSFDADNNGELDVDEFRIMVDTMRLGLNQNAIERLFNIFDEDGSGALDIEEFVSGIGLNKQNMIF